MASMKLTNWLKNMTSRRASFVATRRSARPCLEYLEGRVVLSTVSNLNDTGVGSLRDAIANTPAGGIVDFQPGLTGTLTLTSGELLINKSLTINGPGSNALTISGGGASRVFDLPLSTSSISISNLTIANGATSGGTTGWGGAIENRGALTVSQCTLTGNFAQFGGGAIDDWGPLNLNGDTFTHNTTTASMGGGGGAIYSSRGVLTVIGSSFSGNSGQQGGAIINNSGTLNIDTSAFSRNVAGVGGGVFNVFGTGTITNSTFSNNVAGISAGFAGGGIANSGNATLTISGCTINGNTAGAGAIPGGGGGIYNQDSTLTITNSTISGNNASIGGGIENSYSTSATTLSVANSTIAGNTSTNGGGVFNRPKGTLNAFDTIIATNVSPGSADVSGPITSQGHNLIGDATGGSGYGASDLLGSTSSPINPLLGPLQNNGGPTQTMALLNGSPAINAGSTTSVPQWDQRGVGFPRIINGSIDIGAFESQITTTSITPTVSVNAVNIGFGTALANSQLTGTATAVVNGLTVNVPGTFSYTTAAGVVLNAGNGQVEQVTFTPNDLVTYGVAGTTVVVNVAQATPVFSNLSSPSITFGTATTTLSGHLAAGNLVPAGDTVSITLNGVTQTATVDSLGNFSSGFATGVLASTGSPNSIVYAFAGDGKNFAAALSGHGTLSVTPAGSSISAVGLNLTPKAGAPFSDKVATFINGAPNGTASTYSAIISWGDGATSLGVITGIGNNLAVVGNHTYADPGTFVVHVTITDKTGSLSSTTTTASASVSSSSKQVGATRESDFWNSSSGQHLILSFNGSQNSTALATWLSTNFPNLYGTSAGANNLSGRTNKGVAGLFQSLWNANENGPDVQVLTTALNVYASTSSLGGAQGKPSGFQVTDTGEGALRFNVAGFGGAVGVVNNSKRNVFELLEGVNKLAKNGLIGNGNANLQQLTNSLFTGLNTL